LKNKITAKFPAKDQQRLSLLCLQLLAQQKEKWPQLNLAHLALSVAQTRTVSCGGFRILLQHNPQRATNSGAAVDKESIKNRPCFLCGKNLPAEQKGILYKENYLILCNPAPVFSQHFTIAHKRHLPQEIAFSLTALLDATYDLAPEFAVFYNGAACGASAPDHLHFQAVPQDALPVVQRFPRHFRPLKKIDGMNFYGGENFYYPVLALEGENKDTVQTHFNRLMKIIQKIKPQTDEPMINVICTYTKTVWRLLIFLRRKHRPAAFYLEEDKKIFVSPGAIDLAGIIITPRLADFQRLDASQITGIYQEVLMATDTVDQIIVEI